jgi:plasmid stabilization system protein ParE
VTRLVFAPRALDDIDRLAEFVRDESERLAAETGPLLVGGLQVLKEHPLIGRPAEQGLRELMISRGRTGYVALYRYLVASDTALVLAIRHQRETTG